MIALAKPHCELSTVVLTSTIAAVSEAVKKVIDNNKEPDDKEILVNLIHLSVGHFCDASMQTGKGCTSTYHKGKLTLAREQRCNSYCMFIFQAFPVHPPAFRSICLNTASVACFSRKTQNVRKTLKNLA